MDLFVANEIGQCFPRVPNLKSEEVSRGEISLSNCGASNSYVALELSWALTGIPKHRVVSLLSSTFFMKKQSTACDTSLAPSSMSESLDVIWIQDTKREGSSVEGEVVDKFETSLDKSTTVDEVSLLLF